MRFFHPLLNRGLAVGLLLLGSCAKNGEQPAPASVPASSLNSQLDARQLQQLFQEQQYDQQLTFPLKDQAVGHWTPRWDRATPPIATGPATYVYVPLEAAAVEWIGVQKYLLVKRLNGAVTFSEATYLFKSKENAGKGPANARAFFAAFTGTLLLKDLATGEVGHLLYRKGVVQPRPAAKRGATPSPGVVANSETCYTVVECYWTGQCHLTNNDAATYGTTTTGIDYCESPSDDGVGCSFIVWQKYATNSTSHCNYSPDPGPGPGGGGGGGGDDGGSTYYFDDSIDDTALKPCMVTILNNIKALGPGKIESIITKFSGQGIGYNWKMQNGSLPTGTNGSTQGSYDRTTNSAITTFDASQFTRATDLSVARTIMHESIHSYLLAYFANDPTLANASYPAMVAAYATQTNASGNSLQHDEMVRGWVQDIAYALQQYGQSKGYNLSNDFYIYMSWGGLEDTSAFKSFPAATQAAIRDVILTELNGSDSSGNARTQQGTAAGC